MGVINNTALLVRRIRELQRRRDALLETQDRVRRRLPEWTFTPLQLVGMTGAEIRSVMNEMDQAESAAGFKETEREIEALDQQLEELENELLTTPSRSLESVHAVLDLAVGRFRSQTATDPDDVFYDYGDARVLFFLERAVEDLREMMVETQREAV